MWYVEKDYDTDFHSIVDMLQQQHHEYQIITSASDAVESPVPIGTLGFVQDILRQAYNIPYICPLEIPACLRYPRFIGRNWHICEKKDLPVGKQCFIKDVSRLKTFSFGGILTQEIVDSVNPEHLFSVSDYVADIQAEYRIIVIAGNIESVSYYNGNPLVFPDPYKIHGMVGAYLQSDGCSWDFCMDVMVRPAGTYLVELHPVLFSCGLYTTLVPTGLPYALHDNIKWLKRHNEPLEVSN